VTTYPELIGVSVFDIRVHPLPGVSLQEVRVLVVLAAPSREA